MKSTVSDRLSWIIVEFEKRLGINTALSTSLPEIEVIRKYDELMRSRFPQDAGLVALEGSRRYKITANSVWFVKLPDSSALSKMRIEKVTPCTVTLTGASPCLFSTVYHLSDIRFIEPVSVEPPKLDAIYLEVTCTCPVSIGKGAWHNVDA